MRRLLVLLVLFISVGAHAQKVAIGTNVVDWAYLGTANIESGVSIGQHFSAFVGGRFNPWPFYSERRDKEMYNSVRNAYVGMRYWPWYVYSGWWVALKGQYEQFMTGGIWRPIVESGTAIGAGLSGGYTVMLHKNINLEFGMGVKGGRYLDYTRYQCSDCQEIITSGSRNFFQMDNLVIAFVYVF